MLGSTLRLALRAISRNLMRSFLTILGIVIGIAAVTTLVAVGKGATKSVSDQIASMGTNQLIVVPGQGFGPGATVAPNFKMSDFEAMKSQLASVQAIAPIATKSLKVVHQANNWATTVTGTTNDYFAVANWQLSAGRTFNDAEERAGKAVCVVGETVRKKLFETQDLLAAEIRVGNMTCEVIGLLKSKGQAAMGQDQDDVIVMPLRTVQRRLAGTTDIGRFLVSVKPSASMTAASEQLTGLLRERRRIGHDEDDDFRILDTRQLAETLTGTTRILTMLLGAVAGVSLVVGGIGIMNIMLVSVAERTREIGIRLAIGALGRDVLLQFLIEAVVLAAIGGVVGLALATGASIGLARLLQVPYVFDAPVNVGALLFSALVGVVFGYFPARRAARLDPIEAVRHE
jgi:putative ABC transport system permease protein